MEEVNLMDAREGDSPEKKQGKTEYRILSSVFHRVEQTRTKGSDDFSTKLYGEVRFYKNARADETRLYRVTDLSLALRLTDTLNPFDLVEVRFSEDGREVVDMVKLGHLYFEGEEKSDGPERRPGREGEVENG